MGVALLVGCGGGGGGGSTAVVPGPAAPPAVQAQGTATVRFTLTVPSTAASAARQTKTISPSTQSVGIVVNGSTKQVFAAMPTSPGCAAGSGGTTCTFTVAAPVGSDTFVVTTYSGTNGTGAALDQMTMIQAVTNGVNPAVAVTLGPVISNTQDSGQGSLRQAVADANAGDTITFIGSTPVTITLTSGAVTLTKNVTIAGPGAANLTISGNNASQIFVNSGVTVTISGVTLMNGHAAGSSAGGAIANAGILVVNSVTFSSNTGANGAAIWNEGSASLTVTGSTFTGNSITPGEGGGAIYSVGSAALLSITGSTFTNNSAQYGGAIENDGPATLTNDTFNNNGNGGSFGYGGAIYAPGALTVAGCTFTSNVAGGGSGGGYGYGGAINASNTLTISGSTFTGNSAGGTGSGSYGYGGAINGGSSALTLNNDTFSGNTAGGTNYGYGGAIETNTPISGTNDTFSSNSAFGTSATGYGYGGAIDGGGAATITLTNSTFNGNSANASASTTGYAYGGAVSAGAAINFTAVSFTSNSALGGSSGSAYGGGVYIGGVGSNSITGGAFTTNSAIGAFAYGGAIYEGTSLTQSGISFSGNTPLPNVYVTSIQRSPLTRLPAIP